MILCTSPGGPCLISGGLHPGTHLAPAHFLPVLLADLHVCSGLAGMWSVPRILPGSEQGKPHLRGQQAGRPGVSKPRRQAASVRHFLSLLSGRRRQVLAFFPSLSKSKEASFKILCCHDDTWFHPNFSQTWS